MPGCPARTRSRWRPWRPLGGEEQMVVSHFALGTWLNNQKARRNKLTAEQLGQLQALGVAW